MNTQLVHLSNNRLVTTSLDISNHFGKKHKDVLRAIQEIDCSKEFNERNFAPISYTDSMNREKPAYEITRDGFVFLCMGFTGAAAAQWKERYINAFNQMENHIATNHAQLEALKAAYLQTNPEAEKLLRYREMGLTYPEIGKLLGCSHSAAFERMKRLAKLGLIDYQPDPELSQRGKKGVAKMLEQKQAQQSLDLGE